LGFIPTNTKTNKLSRGKMGEKFLDSGDETYIFIIQLLESFNMSPDVISWEHSYFGFQKSGKIGTTWVSGKGDLTGKIAMFGGFSRNVPQYI